MEPSFGFMGKENKGENKRKENNKTEKGSVDTLSPSDELPNLRSGALLVHIKALSANVSLGHRHVTHKPGTLQSWTKISSGRISRKPNKEQ